MQNIKRRYDRFFIMFRQELSGYSIDGREPNGYCKIEIRDGKGRISTYIQGLKPLSDGSMYRVYLISSQGNKSLGIPIGWLDINNRGRGECRWEFNPDDLEGTGLAIEDFNIGAIIVKGDKINELIAPIVGYRDKEVLWKKGFKDFSVYANSNDDSISNKVSSIQSSVTITKPESKSNTKAATKDDSDVSKYINISPKEQISPKPKQETKPNNTEEIKKEVNTMPETKLPEMPLNINVDDKSNEIKQMPNEVPKEDIKKDKTVDTQKDKNNCDNKIEEETNPHKIFNDMVSKFYAEMAELEKYKILTAEDKKALDLELEPKQEEIDDIEYMFKNNESIIPFERANRAIHWIKIAPFELVTLNLPTWAYVKHQFINAGWKKYKYLILGRYPHSHDKDYSYILGVPDTYDEKYSPIAQSLGFKKFVCCKGRIFQKGDMGYWLMEL